MSSSFSDLHLSAFIESLGAKTPAPGGGAAACVSAATGMALARMVLAYSIDKKSLAEHAEANQADETALGDLAAHALALADVDANAYATLNDLWKKPESDPARLSGWDDAVAAAIDAPMRLMHACIDALDRCEAMRERTNIMLHSDLTGAIHLLVAALHAAGETARVNLPSVRDDARRSELDAQISAMLD